MQRLNSVRNIIISVTLVFLVIFAMKSLFYAGSGQDCSLLTNHSGSISVRNFGAKGDGKTDDTQSINKALEAALSAGNTLKIPAGKYLISSPIIISGSVAIEGDGQQRSILLGSFDGPILSYDAGLINALGNISQGSNILTVTDNKNIAHGRKILIRGAGDGGAAMMATVSRVSGNAITLNNAAKTTVNYAPVRLHFLEGEILGCSLTNIGLHGDGTHEVSGIEFMSLKDSNFKNISMKNLKGNGIVAKSFNNFALTTDEHHSANLTFENIRIDGNSSHKYTKNGIITEGACLALASSNFSNVVISYCQHAGISLRSALRINIKNLTESTNGGTNEVLDGGLRIAHSGLFSPRDIVVDNPHFDTCSPSSILIESGINISLSNTDYSCTNPAIQRRNLAVAPHIFGNTITTIGSIEAGSNILKVESADGLTVGRLITVVGASFGKTLMVAKVVSVKGMEIVLSDIASVAVSGTKIASPVGAVINVREEQSYHALPAVGKNFVPYEFKAASSGFATGIRVSDSYFTNSAYTPIVSSDNNIKNILLK